MKKEKLPVVIVNDADQPGTIDSMDRKRADKALRILDEYFAGSLPAELEQRIRCWLTGGEHRREKDHALEQLWNKRVDYDPAPGTYAVDSLEAITRQLGFPAEEASKTDENKNPSGAKKPLGAPRRRMWLRVAAVVVPLLTLGGVGMWIARTMRPAVQVTLTADAGTQERYTLPDGSQVWINPGSRVGYTEPFAKNREIRLTGEAFFDVTDDAKKPFTVISDALQATVYGTRFMVTAQPDKDRATVTLHDGSVEVSTGSTQTVLNPGEQIQYYPASGEIHVEEVELEDWTKPSLDFYAATLDDIFGSLERNFDVAIHPEKPSGGSQYTIRFSSRQPVGEVMRVLSSLTKTFDYDIEGNDITITSVPAYVPNAALAAPAAVSLPGGEMSVRQALIEMERQTGKVFGYGMALNASRPVRFQESVMTPDRAIRHIIGEDFTYTVVEDYILIYPRSLEVLPPLVAAPPRPAPSLSGRVLDAATGLPADNTFVEILGEDSTRHPTDEGGVFRFDGLTAGDYIVRVASANDERVIYREVPVRAGESGSVEFTFGSGAETHPDPAEAPRYLVVAPAEPTYWNFGREDETPDYSDYLHFTPASSAAAPGIGIGPEAERQAAGRIDLSEVEARMDGDRVAVSLTLTADALTIERNGQWTIAFFLEGAGERVALPAVRFNEREQRRREANETAPELCKAWWGVSPDSTYTLNYRVVLDRADWMEHAAFGYRLIESDRRDDRLLVEESLIADLNPAPDPWIPNPRVYEKMVRFVAPAAESVKRRSAHAVLHFEYAADAVDAPASQGANGAEYEKITELLDPLLNRTFFERLISPLLSGPLYSVDSITVAGFLPPDAGADASLLERRTASVADGVKQQYSLSDSLMRVEWTPGDWSTLAQMLREDYPVTPLPNRRELLAVLDDPALAPEAKVRILKRIGGGADWELMQPEIFPALQRTRVEAHYTVRELNNRQLREWIFTQPELFSQEEMYRSARSFDQDNPDYAAVFTQAAAHYPQQGSAQNNAAAALLQQGRAQEALDYLQRTPERPEAWINLGAYYYILGDLAKAKHYFLLAHDTGFDGAGENLRLLTEGAERQE